ncbi:MAG: FIST C-terminal domain-containing protein [Rhizobiaceae bacterium]|nr:FIST C-terminal domain-containing protein [Rhizobiaceae bacterium]
MSVATLTACTQRGGGTREEALAVSRTSYACGLIALSTDAPGEDAFVEHLAREAREGQANFALIFYSRSLFESEKLAGALNRHLTWLPHAGCTTAGEITPDGLHEGQAVALLFPSLGFTTSGVLLENISSLDIKSVSGQVDALRRSFTAKRQDQPGLFAICLIDGLSYAEESVTSAIHWELEDIPLVGGSAGDELKFEKTSLIWNGGVYTDSAVVMLFSTDIPFHTFKTDNFVATDNKLVVTASDPARRTVSEFNAAKAADEYAAVVGTMPEDLAPLSFASHPTVVRVGGEYFCRSIQKSNPDGSLSFFCAIDDGIVLSIARAVDLVESTDAALHEIDSRLGGTDIILGFDCVLRRLDAVNRQVVRGLSEVYRRNHVVGFGTYGEQYQSMHLNQTFTGIAFGLRHAAE